MVLDNRAPSEQGAPTRRRIVTTAVASLAFPYVNFANAQSRTLNIASYGGTYGDAVKKAWLDPFEKETGIKVNLGVNASLSMAKLQAMNPSGAEWDIVDLTFAEYEIAMRENLLQPLGNRVDTRKIFPEFVKSHGFGYALFVWVMGWDRRKIPDADAPKTWAEFWNTKKYPGKRTLQTVRTNGNTLEAALLADGVPMDKLYPLDIERALKSLDKLGKQNIIWAQTNQEPVQRLISGETALAGIFTGRALIANRGGAQIGVNLNQGNVGGDMLSVIRTAKNSAAAFELLNYVATRGDRAAEFTAITAYDMPHMDVAQLLSKDADDVRAVLSTSPALKGKIFIQDHEFWSKNLERVATRFKEWQLA